MFLGAHVILYSKDAGADRAFLRDVLGFPHVDAGQGWLIFALPPAEVAFHPAEENDDRELYLLCDDLKTALERLDRQQIRYAAPSEAPWGIFTFFTLPGGGQVGLYQPKHPLALGKWGTAG
jgi:catechol 2,3-dioxygenase-like lactoylglutathione lyase family enzyme